ncbi:MAG: MFS transporter [Phycisphaerae bacterium]|nr:MFS transporter [Phycisphaerae bacterium]
MHKAIKTRLGIMMFLQYVVMGTIWPIISLYLRQVLGFSGTQTGTVLAMSAVAAFVAPVVGACVADRWISAERLLSLCHFLAAMAMGLISVQTRFSAVLALYLVYTLSMGPTVPLTNAITFHHAPGGHRKFGNTRVWGTVAWVVVAWTFGYLWLGKTTDSAAHVSRLPDALKLSAMASLALGLYALTLPRAGQRLQGRIGLIPRESIAVLIRPQVLLIAGISLIVGIIDRYYYFGTALFLKHRGISEALIMPLMSLGQIAEIFAMCVLSRLLTHLGTKRTLLLGLLAEIGRFSAFAFGTSTASVLVGNACHGLAYTFFFTAVYITIDSFCDKASRTGLHQLFTIITSGFGALSANLLAGYCLDRFVSASASVDYRSFWLVPLIMAALSFVVLALFLRDRAES